MVSQELEGRVKWEGAFPFITPFCESFGLQGTQLVRMGEYEVLLTLVDAEQALQMIRDFEFAFSQYFSKLDRWNWKPGPSSSKSRVWLRCYGVPVPAWDSMVFEEIGKRFGKEGEDGCKVCSRWWFLTGNG